MAINVNFSSTKKPTSRSFGTCAYREFVTKIDSNRDQHKPLYEMIVLNSDHVYHPFFVIEFDSLKQKIDENTVEEKLGDCVDFLCSKFDVVYEDSISIISDYMVGDVCFGYFQLCVYAVEKTMTEILSFVEENKTEMKGLGFSSIYKGDLFSWKTPFAPSNFDSKQYSGLYGDDRDENRK